MLVKTKKVYYCEFCGRHRLRSVQKHEDSCTANPNRICNLCGRQELGPILAKYRDRYKMLGEETSLSTIYEWISGPVTVDQIKEDVDYCPACTLAVLRICGLCRHFFADDLKFDYQREHKEWWDEKNAEMTPDNPTPY